MCYVQVNIMLKELPEDEFGPRINIREYSLLDNPLMSKKARIRIRHCFSLAGHMLDDPSDCIFLTFTGEGIYA